MQISKYPFICTSLKDPSSLHSANIAQMGTGNMGSEAKNQPKEMAQLG